MGSNFSGATAHPELLSRHSISCSSLLVLFSPKHWNPLCSSGENRLGDLSDPRQAFKSKLIGLIQVTLGYFYLPFLCVCGGGDNLLGGIFWGGGNLWIHEIHTVTQAPALNSKHSNFSRCVQAKWRKDPWSQQSQARLRALKITVSTLQGQRSAHSLFRRDERKPCEESSPVKELITMSILGTAPLWVTEPSMWASTRLTNSPIPINHTEHFVSVSAAR